MYESSNVENVEKIIATSDFSELRFTSLRDNKGKLVGVDIRQWYSTQKDPVKKPTQKGVRFKDETIVESVTAILKMLDKDTLDEVFKNLE